MQLLIITRELAGDARFGLGKAVRQIASELRGKGHTVDLISAADWTDDDRANHLKTARLLQRLGAPAPLADALAQRWIQARRTRKVLQRKSFTHLWFQDPWLAVAFLFLSPRAVCFRSIRWGLSEHGFGSFVRAVELDGLTVPGRWRKTLLWLEDWSLRRADFVLLPTQAVATQLCLELGLSRSPGHWAMIGYGRPAELVVSRQEARRHLGWHEQGFYVLALGRTAPVKRIDLMISACLLAQARGVDVRLVIVGGGLNAGLQDLASSLVHDPICVEVDDPSVYLAAADVYLSACAVESFGLANLEAIAAGLPSVVALGGGAPEVLQDGAWFVEANAENFAQAICSLYEQPALRVRWREAALLRAARIPTWAQLAVPYEASIGGDHAEIDAP